MRQDRPADPSSELSLFWSENSNVHLPNTVRRNMNNQKDSLTSEAGASDRSSLKRRSPSYVTLTLKLSPLLFLLTDSRQHCCSSSQMDLFPQGGTKIHINSLKNHIKQGPQKTRKENLLMEAATSSWRPGHSRPSKSGRNNASAARKRSGPSSSTRSSGNR